MVIGEEDPDLSRILGTGVGLDDGDFDPTSLLSQPINFDEDIDVLDINIDDDGGDAAYLDPIANGGDNVGADGERNNECYYDQDGKSNNEVNDHSSTSISGNISNSNDVSTVGADQRERFFRSPPLDSQAMMNRGQQQDRYDHGQNEGVGEMNNNVQQRRSPHEYDGPPYNHSRNINSQGNASAEEPRNQGPRGKQRHGGRNNERIAQVQHRIRQVQQRIHENMDGDHNTSPEMTGSPQHPYQQEPGFAQHQDREQMYSDNYPDEAYHNGGPRDRFPPRDPSRNGTHMSRSSNGMPSDMHMRGGGDSYGEDHQQHHRRRSHQQPLQQQHRGPSMMSHSQSGMHSHNDPRGNDNDNGYGPQDRRHTMHLMRRGESGQRITQSLNDMPVHNHNNGQGGFCDGPGGMQQQHVLGGMSQSLNGMAGHGNNGNDNSNNSMGNPMMQQQQCPPQHMRPMPQPVNGAMQNMNMNASNNGNMPRKGIQSMSDSLNGVNNQPRMDRSNNGMDPSSNGINRSRNGMDRSNNGNMPQQRGIQSMSASLNGMQNMNHSNNNNQNAMMNNNMIVQQQQQEQRGIQSMSASLNGMQQVNAEQNISQSMNGMQGGYGGQHQGQPPQQGGPESMGMPMNRSLNGMQNMQHSHNGGTFRHQQQHHGMNPMSPNQGGGFPPQQQGGGHPLQGMSQSLNGAPNPAYGGVGHHQQSMPNQMTSMPRDHGMQMNNSNMNMMNRSNNMGSSMNGRNMNASNNSGPILNNSNVPSASLLNQVSNLANLPNRSGGANNPDMMHHLQQGGGQDTSKLSRKLMEAMKRTASTRKLIRELNIAAMLRGDLKSPSSSKKKSVVKAKRKAGRQSYTKSQSEAAASRARPSCEGTSAKSREMKAQAQEKGEIVI